MRPETVTKAKTLFRNPIHFSLIVLGSALFALITLAPSVHAQTYVDASVGAGSGDGTQASPYGDLQTALANTSSGEIRVAAGTYYPDEGQAQTDNDRSASFDLKMASRSSEASMPRTGTPSLLPTPPRQF